jgi:hypothetical protein
VVPICRAGRLSAGLQLLFGYAHSSRLTLHAIVYPFILATWAGLREPNLYLHALSFWQDRRRVVPIEKQPAVMSGIATYRHVAMSA